MNPGDSLGPGREFDLIRRFLHAQKSVRDDVPVGPGDDCAVIRGDGIAVSTDMSVEGVHFRRDWLLPREIGWRSASGALSDLAAVAARPIGLLVSLAVPDDDAGDFAVELMAGVAAAAEASGAALLGGDLTRSPSGVVVDVTVIGEAPTPVRRSGAQHGDEVWVTGRLGGAALCVYEMLAGRAPPPAARQAYAAPAPRTREALWLQEKLRLKAMIDLSDGLGGDASHMAAASAVAIVLELPLIPVDPDVRRAGLAADAAERLALSGGEDYELLFSASAGAAEHLAADFEERFGIPLTRVGTVESGTGVHASSASGERRPLTAGGFQHFGGG